MVVDRIDFQRVFQLMCVVQKIINKKEISDEAILKVKLRARYFDILSFNLQLIIICENVNRLKILFILKKDLMI